MIFCEKEFACEENNKDIKDRCLNCAAHLYSINPNNYLNTNRILNSPKKYLNTIEYGTILNCPYKDKNMG